MSTKEDTKAMTLRLPHETAKDLEATAKVDGVTVSEAVREAIETHIESRRQDTDFRDRLRRSIEENKELLERLAR
jgi:predicted DNA-binding protein